MKFWNRYRNARYTIHPTYWKTSPYGRETVYGTHAQFEDNMYDSEADQREKKWSDEQREEVETYLLEHRDYGKTMRSLSDNDDIENIKPVSDIATCLYMVTIDGEVDVCGRPATSEDGYCSKHAAMQDKAPKEHSTA